MTQEKNKIYLIIQYALLTAGLEDDYSDRDLGPIHLIKYVYLADLIHARRTNGKTYTGVEWQFYKFGPWSQQVNTEIEPALNAIHAECKLFESRHENREDWVRWYKRDNQLLHRIEQQLPIHITRDLKRDIHKFRKDTSSLLDYIYKTPPMLSAAPNEYLDFAIEEAAHIPEERNPHNLMMDQLSIKKQKKFKDRMKKIRAEHESGTRDTHKKLVIPTSPRYDQTYAQGIEWLEEQAGQKFSDKEIIIEFSDDVWKSSTRKKKDVS